MRYVAAYMLASLSGGKAEPTAADIEKILGSVGIDAEGDKVKKVISELKGKKLEEVIEEGSKKLASVPSGGAVAAPAAGGGGGGAPAQAKEEKKEEKKEESEESDDDMGFGLFD